MRLSLGMSASAAGEDGGRARRLHGHGEPVGVVQYSHDTVDDGFRGKFSLFGQISRPGTRQIALMDCFFMPGTLEIDGGRTSCLSDDLAT